MWTVSDTELQVGQRVWIVFSLVGKILNAQMKTNQTVLIK